MHLLKNFFQKYDQYFLTHFPVAWSIRAHYFLLFSFAIGNLLALTIGFFFPLSFEFIDVGRGSTTAIEWRLEISVQIILGCFYILSFFYAIYLNRSCPRNGKLIKYVLLFLCCLSLGFNLFLFQAVVLNRLVFLGDTNSINKLKEFSTSELRGKSSEMRYLKIDDQFYSYRDSRSQFSLIQAYKIDNKYINDDSLSSSYNQKVIVLSNKDNWETFANYIQKYRLYDILDFQENRSSPSFFDGMSQLKNQNDSQGIIFPIIFSSRSSHYLFEPISSIIETQNQYFVNWLNDGFYIFYGIFLIIIPSFLFLLSENDLPKFIYSIVHIIAQVIFFTLALRVSTNNYLGYVIAGIGILIILGINKFLFVPKSVNIRKQWINIGFFYIFILLFFTLIIIGEKIQGRENNIEYLIGGLPYLIFSGVYFYFFYHRQIHLPDKI